MPPADPGIPRTLPVTVMLPSSMLIFMASNCTAQAGAAVAVPRIVMLLAVINDAEE